MFRTTMAARMLVSGPTVERVLVVFVVSKTTQVNGRKSYSDMVVEVWVMGGGVFNSVPQVLGHVLVRQSLPHFNNCPHIFRPVSFEPSTS